MVRENGKKLERIYILRASLRFYDRMGKHGVDLINYGSQNKFNADNKNYTGGGTPRKNGNFTKKKIARLKKNIRGKMGPIPCLPTCRPRWDREPRNSIFCTPDELLGSHKFPYFQNLEVHSERCCPCSGHLRRWITREIMATKKVPTSTHGGMEQNGKKKLKGIEEKKEENVETADDIGTKKRWQYGHYTRKYTETGFKITMGKLKRVICKNRRGMANNLGLQIRKPGAACAPRSASARDLRRMDTWGQAGCDFDIIRGI